MPRYLNPALLLLAFAAPLHAANFYKYVDANGVVTYANQPQQATQPSANPQQVAQPAPADGRFNPGQALYGAITNRARDNQRLQALLQHDIAQQTRQHSLHLTPLSLPPHNPTAAPSYRYARPWKTPGAVLSQGFNGRFSHHTAQSRYAVDIAMPEGTAIYAARAGTVVTVSDNQHGQGNSANGKYLRILHRDGSSSAYLHLQHGSALVEPGQWVALGQALANSGNTGRSTGPHLHFVVQQRVGGRYASIPFAFANPPPALPNFADSRD